MASFSDSPTDNRGKAEWLIRAPQGGTLTLSVIAERGGTIRQQIELVAWEMALLSDAVAGYAPGTI